MATSWACQPAPSSLRPTNARRMRSMAAVRCMSEGNPQVYQLTLRKPLGMVLAERQRPGAPPEVFVEELVPGGNAEKDGRVRVGDVLSKCQATILKAGKEGEYETEGYGQRPYDNWEQVFFDAKGKKFDTVMAAIASNSERWGIFTVKLEFIREGPTETAAEPPVDPAPES